LAFSACADDDLTDIALYIARDSPQRARSFVAEMRQWCEGLIRYPERYPLMTEYGAGIRRASYGFYGIYYSVHADEVLVEHVVHSARDVGPQYFR
jgi:toxin ParE1/3/4